MESNTHAGAKRDKRRDRRENNLIQLLDERIIQHFHIPNYGKVLYVFGAILLLFSLRGILKVT